MGRPAITPKHYRGYVVHLNRLIEATENDTRYAPEWRDEIRRDCQNLIRGLMIEPPEQNPKSKRTVNAKR